ncbi:branched-chain amino acid aminotransferase [Phyllobacterium sp. 21LDTY02-6]|uniref:branched-chain amino acid aminotransferase n=1 Tax=unclassified Phyllobacterium TaxID=2638441 RepID=UPI0020204E15|nr:MULTISPECIES: branched-chain amino acid aminotransferase [unclassified Phyllobacterium]MCO4318383.1 branched-chain amino acid aminotransferase [Phyllobacterium sp. 21LDTY02-6]MCX8281303.1 branched-chain amino acid aminotransferase [Phyllobacterium sp. 0TCS1.6C]MCX8296041.1 branched-chain amino acid aminotransferase [Phyllobacterium sp. 0TCS1.6A]
MAINTAAQTLTWTYVDGDWFEGNVPLIGPRSHAMWLASTVFDGARWFEGVAPDLDRHCARVNNSATALGLKPTMGVDEIVGLTHEGLKKFDGKTAVYIRPMYWGEHGGYMGVPADPESTRFCLSIYEAPMLEPTGFSLTVSPFRRPTLETMPTNAKAGCLYPNNGRAILEARSRGFDNALVLDMLGNVAETGTSNIFLVKDGHIFTPAPNGTFLSGITRSRVIDVLADYGFRTTQTTLTVQDFLDADEIFSTGNHSKVVPVSRIEDRELALGPITRKARELYWEFAHSTPKI